MDPPWVYALPVAFAVTVVGTPLLRRFALATNIVDRPDARKSHVSPVSYLGGVGLIAGVLVALLFLPGLGGRAAALALVAVTLGAVGLLDDARNVPPGVRFLAEIGAAALAVSVGVRIHATGIEVIDMVLTMVWILGITNALNLLDNMDGLAAGVAGLAAAGVFFLGILSGQQVTATVAVGLVGACGGFLVFNRRPASIFMGDAGSLFLGFVLSILAIDVSPGLAPPVSFVVPVILLGLAVLDTTTVTLSRLRRGRSVSTGGKDHLSHRLVALGLSPGGAVGVLLGAQAVLVVVAVLAGRAVVGAGTACAIAAVTLVALSLTTRRATVYPEPAGRFPAWLRLGVVGAAVVVGLLTAPAVVAMVRAGSPAQEGAAVATAALRGVGDGDPGRTRTELERAGAFFRQAQGRLDNRLASLGLLVPGVSSNLRAARALTAAGSDLTTEGGRVAAVADAGGMRVGAGTVDADQLSRLGPALDDAARALTRVRDRLSSADRPYVLPRYRNSIRALVEGATTEARAATLVAETARALPGVLGHDGPRRYLVMVAGSGRTGAGTTGPLDPGGQLVAEGGRLRFEPLDAADAPPALSPADDLSSPDFPTVARALTSADRVGDRRTDGVIWVDTTGLAALAGLSGSVPMAGEPQPLTADNLVEVASRASMSRVSDAVLGRAVTADLGTGRRVVTALAPAVRGGHLMMYLADPDEQEALSRLGATGEVPPIRGDSLMVVCKPLSPDGGRHLQREVTYDVRLDPGPGQARLSGQVAVSLRNDAPLDGTPSEAESRTAISVYSPFPVASVADGGGPRPLRSDEDLGRRVGSAVLDVPPSQTRTLRFQLAGDITLANGGWYRLDVLPELGSPPGEGRINVSVPPGWRIVDARGLSTGDANHASGPLPAEREPSLWVRVVRSPAGQLWDSLLGRT